MSNNDMAGTVPAAALQALGHLKTLYVAAGMPRLTVMGVTGPRV